MFFWLSTFSHWLGFCSALLYMIQFVSNRYAIKNMKYTRLFECVVLSVSLLFAQAAPAAEAAKPVAAVVASAVPTDRTLSLEVAVLRFKPNSAERILRGFKDLGGNLQSVVESLKADGAVNILYLGNRAMRLEDKAKAKFDALETRPIILVGKPGAPTPPLTSYGVALEISTRPIDAERFGLSWEGSITWSPEIVDAWKGEKFLSFISAAAGVAKKASSVAGVESKDVSSGTDIGLSFAQLFNPKGSPTDNQIYELPVNKTVSLSSSRNCRSGELIINATTAEMGNKEAQTILLLVWPTINP